MEKTRSPYSLVLLRNPSGKRSPFALFCTDSTVPLLQIVAWYGPLLE